MLYSSAGAGSSTRGVCPESSVVSLSTIEPGCPEKVYQLQEQLNRIRQNYPALPYVNPDGIYGQQTANAVRAFQQVFDLPATGITDYPTWYEISRIYVGVSRIAEPD